MKNIRIVVEYRNPETSARLMRWERTAVAEASAFELLGRAFEVVQREEGLSLNDSLQAFMRGAMLEKQDLLDALSTPA